ncbi:MAG TPA: T9SS type A sorting domain-containing protein [Bacteroidales bacterium]
MKKLFRLLSVLSIALALFAVAFLINKPDNHREKYEQFILEKASALPKSESIKEDLKAPDQPDMAAFQEFITTVDPKLGYVPKKRLINSYRETIAMANQTENLREYEPPVEWEGTVAYMGGRTRALMFDPNSNGYKKVWAGGVTGGLWYIDDITTTNKSWVPVDDFWANLAISCITYDPNNTQVFYVGTGEAQTARIIYRESSGVGAGIYKTSDAGQTWELLASTEDFDYITDIAVRDEDGQSVVYAAVASGTYMGEDHESQPTDGLYRSTDGGENWEQVLPPFSIISEEPYTPADIEIAANGRIFVGTMENLNKLGGATVLYSDSGLEGSWSVYNFYNTKISSESYYKIPARTIIASAPSDPNIVYAQFAAGYTNGFTYYRGRYMAKSVDGGETWTQLNTPPTDEWSTLAWHAFILKVDPSNPNSIFTGGLDLWKSQNGGQNYSRVSDWSLMYWGGGDEYVHADQHNIQYQPENPTSSIFSSDGGVFYTATANQAQPVFKERNKGYNTLQFYSCAIDPTPGAKRYIGGLQDNGTLFYNNSPLDINDMIDGGDGAYCFWDNNESNIFITSVYYNAYSVWVNDDYYDGFGGNSGTFISPADYDYKLNILYGDAVDFFGGNANKLLRTKGIPYSMVDNLIDLGTSSSVPFSHVKYSRFAPNGTSTLFVGTQSGKLYKVTNAESTPITTNIGSPDFPTANISCVALGENENELLVTFSNYGVSSVWLTMDGGETWQEKEANLPDMPIRWAIFHPDNNGQAMLATELGIWATNTLQEDETEWSPASAGMGNVRVDMLQFRHGDDIVLAASHGRGLFTTTYNVDVYTSEKETFTEQNNFSVFPNPASDFVSINFDSFGQQNVLISITDMNGRIILQKNISASSGKVSEKIEISELSKGVYVVSVQNNDRLSSRKIVVR